jgi:hypothetical protein
MRERALARQTREEALGRSPNSDPYILAGEVARPLVHHYWALEMRRRRPLPALTHCLLTAGV